MSAVTPQMLRDVAKAAGLTGAEASELIGCNPRTWRRWVGGESECPVAVYEWIRVVTGQHPEFSPAAVDPDTVTTSDSVPSERAIRQLARDLRRAIGSEVWVSIGEGFSGSSREPFERHLSVTLESGDERDGEMYEIGRQVLEVGDERCVVIYWARNEGPDRDDGQDKPSTAGDPTSGLEAALERVSATRQSGYELLAKVEGHRSPAVLASSIRMVGEQGLLQQELIVELIKVTQMAVKKAAELDSRVSDLEYRDKGPSDDEK